MEFAIPCHTLLRLAQRICGICDKKQLLPILSNVLICIDPSSISLIGSDLELELTVKEPIQLPGVTGKITAPSRKILDICRNLPENEEISCKLEGNKLTLKAQGARFTLTTWPAEDFPLIHRNSAELALKLPQNVFKEMLLNTRVAMATNDVRHYLNGVFFEVVDGIFRTIATDGHRLAVSEFDAATDVKQNLAVIVPRKAIQELVSLLSESPELVQIEVEENTVRFVADNFELVTKQVEGRFPDYRRVIPPPASISLELGRDALKQNLLRASVLSNEKSRAIRLQLDQDLLKIVAKNQEQEEAEVWLPLQYQGTAFEIGFNASYLMDALNSLNGEFLVLQLQDPSASALVRSPAAGPIQHFHVVMPLRI